MEGKAQSERDHNTVKYTVLNNHWIMAAKVTRAKPTFYDQCIS